MSYPINYQFDYKYLEKEILIKITFKNLDLNFIEKFCDFKFDINYFKLYISDTFINVIISVNKSENIDKIKLAIFSSINVPEDKFYSNFRSNIYYSNGGTN